MIRHSQRMSISVLLVMFSSSVAHAQWFERVTKVWKDVTLSSCFVLGEIVEDYIQRIGTAKEYDIIEANYPYQERSEHAIFFSDSAEREVQEKKYSRLVNHIEKISISEKDGNEATVKARLKKFIGIKKAFSCKEVEP